MLAIANLTILIFSLLSSLIYLYALGAYLIAAHIISSSLVNQGVYLMTNPLIYTASRINSRFLRRFILAYYNALTSNFLKLFL